MSAAGGSTPARSTKPVQPRRPGNSLGHMFRSPGRAGSSAGWTPIHHRSSTRRDLLVTRLGFEPGAYGLSDAGRAT